MVASRVHHRPEAHGGIQGNPQGDACTPLVRYSTDRSDRARAARVWPHHLRNSQHWRNIDSLLSRGTGGFSRDFRQHVGPRFALGVLWADATGRRGDGWEREARKKDRTVFCHDTR